MLNHDDNPVPFHVRLVRYARIEDRLRHRLEFGVVGVSNPAAVMIGSDFYRSPVIEERLELGGIDLPDRLMDSIAIGCFRVLAHYVTEADGECGTWTVADVTGWLRHRFSPDDAEQVVGALAGHVTPGWEVRNMVVVGDDDVVLADDLR